MYNFGTHALQVYPYIYHTWSIYYIYISNMCRKLMRPWSISYMRFFLGRGTGNRQYNNTTIHSIQRARKVWLAHKSIDVFTKHLLSHIWAQSYILCQVLKKTIHCFFRKKGFKFELFENYDRKEKDIVDIQWYHVLMKTYRIQFMVEVSDKNGSIRY